MFLIAVEPTLRLGPLAGRWLPWMCAIYTSKICGYWAQLIKPREVFENLISYIERGEIRPLVAKTYLKILAADPRKISWQKHSAGKLVLIPMSINETNPSQIDPIRVNLEKTLKSVQGPS